jgi:hypothetical protein
MIPVSSRASNYSSMAAGDRSDRRRGGEFARGACENCDCRRNAGDAAASGRSFLYPLAVAPGQQLPGGIDEVAPQISRICHQVGGVRAVDDQRDPTRGAVGISDAKLGNDGCKPCSDPPRGYRRPRIRIRPGRRSCNTAPPSLSVAVHCLNAALFTRIGFRPRYEPAAPAPGRKRHSHRAARRAGRSDRRVRCSWRPRRGRSIPSAGPTGSLSDVPR